MQPNQSKPNDASPDRGEMGLLEHLGELRRRLIFSFIAVMAGAIVAYCFSQDVFELLSRPYVRAFNGQQLIGTGPAEAFLLRLKVALFAGAIIASPIVFLQIWFFISPGLYDHEKKLMVPFLFSATFLFGLGLSFCYTFVLPVAFDFFRKEYETIGLTPNIRLSEHLSMVVSGLLSFGLIFETPVLAFFLGRLGIIDHRTLIGGFRYALVVIFIVAAVLTPPDVISQFLMAGPLILLYAISILIVKWTCRTATDRDTVAESTPLPKS